MGLLGVTNMRMLRCTREQGPHAIEQGFELDIIEEKNQRKTFILGLQKKPKDTPIVKVNSWNFEKIRRESG